MKVWELTNKIITKISINSINIKEITRNVYFGTLLLQNNG